MKKVGNQQMAEARVAHGTVKSAYTSKKTVN